MGKRRVGQMQTQMQHPTHLFFYFSPWQVDPEELFRHFEDFFNPFGAAVCFRRDLLWMLAATSKRARTPTNEK